MARHLKKGCARPADDGSMFGFEVYDVSGDLDDVGIARSGGGEGQADVAHGLGCLRSKVPSTNDTAPVVDRHLSRR